MHTEQPSSPERLLASIAKGLPIWRKDIESEQLGIMASGDDHRFYHDLSIGAAALAGDLFDLIGPRCTAFLVWFLAEKMEEISQTIEDRSGVEDWGLVQVVAANRTDAPGSKFPAPLFLTPAEGSTHAS